MITPSVDWTDERRVGGGRHPGRRLRGPTWPPSHNRARCCLAANRSDLPSIALLAEARAGRSGVLALVGEPGIGKTALLEHAVRAPTGCGCCARAASSPRREVPFAGLAELLRPALAGIDRIPAPQAQALSGALALGPATALDRFAIGAATLSLLSAYADERPVLLADRRRAPARPLERRGAAVCVPAADRRPDRGGAGDPRGRALAAGRRRSADSAARGPQPR